MTCRTFMIGDDAVAITCSRDHRKPARCAFCKDRPHSLLCDFELGGDKKGKTCDAKMCASCAVEFESGKHRCPPHDRFCKATRPNETQRRFADNAAARARDREQLEADAWLAALIAADEKEANVVDRRALDDMFPDWGNEWHSDQTMRGSVRDERGVQWAGNGPVANELGSDRTYALETHAWDGDTCTVCGFDSTDAIAMRDDPPTCEQWRATKPIDKLIGASSVGAAVRDVKRRGVDDHLRSESISSKVAHVRRATQTRKHSCHWPGCEANVPPAMWGCRKHWYALPKYLRDKIWRTYRAGQEKALTPSDAYIDAANEVQDWIAGNVKKPAQSWESIGENPCGDDMPSEQEILGDVGDR